MSKFAKGIAAGAAVAALMVGAAHATEVSGSLSFSLLEVNSVPAGATNLTATGFTENLTPPTPDGIVTTAGTSGLSFITDFNPVSLENPFMFDTAATPTPGVPYFLASPINDFLTITEGGKTLDYELFGLEYLRTGSNFVNINTIGDLMVSGFSATAADLNLTYVSDGSWAGGGTLTAIAGVPPYRVPEPSSIALLGAGLLGAGLCAGFAARRRKTTML